MTHGGVATRAGGARPLVLGGVMAGGLLLVVAGIALFSRAPAGHSSPRPPAPDIKSLPPPSGQVPALGRGEEFFVQFVDRADPTRVAGELAAARSTPLPDRRYALESPQSWLYLRDGRSLFVRADRGEVTLPEQAGQPRSGQLEGSIRILVFAATTDGRRPDAAASAPLATVTTTRLTVDWETGELELPDEVTARGDLVDFSGRAIVVRFEPDEMRLDAVHVEQTTSCVIRPSPEPSASPAAMPTPGAVATAPGSPVPPADSLDRRISLGQISYFVMTAAGNVSLTQGERAIHGDQLQVFARLLDGRLPRTAQSQTSPVRGTDAAPAPERVAQSQPTTDAALTESAEPDPGQAPVQCAWSGPLEFRRVESAPAELSRDDLSLRCSAAPASVVRVTDEGLKAVAQADQVEFAATRSEVTAAGSSSRPATVQADGVGEISCPTFVIDSRGGVARALGAGTLRREAGNGADPVLGEVAWSEQAAFEFDRDAGEASLRRADLLGSVVARQTDGELRGDAMTATFYREQGSATSPRVRDLVVAGNARSSTAEGDSLSASSLVIRFDESDGKTWPSVIHAGGNVQASREGQLLCSDDLVALLAPPTDTGETSQVGNAGGVGGIPGDAQVIELVAGGSVWYSGPAGETTAASLLIADPIGQTAQVFGAPAMLARGGAGVQGSRLMLDAARGALVCPGPGWLWSRQAASVDEAGTARAASVATVAWTESLSYSDASGQADAAGNVVVTLTEDAATSAIARAETVQLRFAPPAEVGKAKPSTAAARQAVAWQGQARQWTSALARAREGGPPVTLELREPPQGETAVGHHLFAQGREVQFEADSGAITIPGEGLLVNSEQGAKPATVAKPNAPNELLAADSRGDSVFRWKESASFNPRSGSAAMKGAVRLLHRRLGDTGVTELNCADLLAQFSQGGTAESGSSENAQRLERVDASGQVWARSGGREITATKLHYDVLKSLIEAQGSPGAPVTVVDAKTGAPATGARITWNLATDRLDVFQPGPVSTPR